MTIGIYLNFKDNTKEVIHFYEKVFGSKCTDLMTYGQQPDESTHELDEKRWDFYRASPNELLDKHPWAYKAPGALCPLSACH